LETVGGPGGGGAGSCGVILGGELKVLGACMLSVWKRKQSRLVQLGQ
jgi:hypothetical protein